MRWDENYHTTWSKLKFTKGRKTAVGSSYARVFPRRAIYKTEIIMEFLPLSPYSSLVHLLCFGLVFKYFIAFSYLDVYGTFITESQFIPLVYSLEFYSYKYLSPPLQYRSKPHLFCTFPWSWSVLVTL
jgi:hypothetical protein